MANEEVIWPVETVPDEDRLFVRVHVKLLNSGPLHQGVLRPRGDSLSTDWEKYSTAQETRDRAKGVKEQNGVIAFVAGQVRSVEGLTVDHSPIPENQAHTDVHGLVESNAPQVRMRNNQLRFRLFKFCLGWVLEPETPA